MQDVAEDDFLDPGQIHAQAYYCQYCGISCDGDEQWDEHCMSETHISNVNSDSEHQWNFRPPPWGHSSNLVLCARHIHNKSCQYSYVPDKYNLCSHAHSQDELDEWKERHEWRQMKRAVARDRNMFSYTDTLLEDYHNQGDSINVISENISGVQIECDQKDVVYRSKKNDILTWKFVLHTETALVKVALLFNKDRLHFKLVSSSEEWEEQHQVASGDLFLDIDDEDKACYKVNVHFSGSMFGSFTQWVVFDFGSRPVLVKKLSVEIGDQLQQERDTGDITSASYFRYKEPSASEDVVTSHSLTELNQHNYIHKMHNLLYLEEITRQSIVARYNLTTDVAISQFVDEKDQGFFIARNGDFFGKVNLPEYLTVDSVAGKLLLSSVRTALITCADSQSNKVYEINFVEQHNYDFDGRGKEYIYFVINAEAAKALAISPGQTVAMELQFQLDRRSFCRMHYALDSLRNLEVVFPDVIKFKPNVKLLKDMAKIKSQFLNEDQLAAVRHIVVPREGATPPLIIYGPFGTGKTETLAQATMALLATQKDQCRILLCTQSNSAADLYITKHFHQFIMKDGGLKMLRLIAEERRFATVPGEVCKYCCYSDDKKFITPSKQEIKRSHIVLTTVENALVLSKFEMYGDFTHIFVDEAGQIIECEALIPLSLASPKTCVVLTGDHYQIGPTVYSQEARCQNFGVSVLERLYNYYLKMEKCDVQELAEKCQQSPLTIFLRMNYRTKREILQFISAVFYKSPGSLKACGDIPDLIEMPPLAFYVVQGKESQRADSISYLNVAEAQEVVARVTELLDNWPLEWGPMEPRQVAVITTYSDQIKYIRYLLRQDRTRPFLKYVDVGPIHSFQGKERIALFISTVRTCHLLREEHIIKALQDGDGIGDLGFLSSREQLNTALTRTQSYVAIIGDPVALCLLGKCSQVWKTYLKYCSTIGSIWPPTYTMDVIRNMAIDILQGPEKCIVDLILEQDLNTFRSCVKKSGLSANQTKTPDSKEAAFSGKESTSTTKTSEVSCNISGRTKVPAVLTGTHASSVVSIEASHPTKNAGTNIAALETKIKKKTKRPHFNELSINGSINSEDIIMHLAQESSGKLAEEACKDKPLKLKNIAFDLEDDGIATLSQKQSDQDSAGSEGEKLFKIAADDDNFVISPFCDKDIGAQTCSENWGKNTLTCKLATEPTKYFKCHISVKNQELATASVMGPPTAHNKHVMGKEIEVQGSVDRGHALHGDIAVVQVINILDDGKMKGQVKGVWKRAHHLDKKLLLCEADVEDIGILKPVNTALPFMYLLTNKHHKPMVRKGYICVYKFGAKSQIKFSHYEKLDFAKQNNVLFVMRFVCWQPNFPLPCGIVVGLIRNDCSLLKGMKITEVEHNIQYSCDEQTELNAENEFSTDSRLPAKFYQDRLDLRQRACFTIDEQSKVVEMAVSVTQSDNSYEVGLHVTDVAAFVDKDSALDRECALRAASLFPLGKEPRHMLPSANAVEMCSLQPGRDRLTISVIIKVDKEGKLCESPNIVLSVINSKQHFSHAEVEGILLSPEEIQGGVFESRVIVLDQLTSIWREQRLGNSHICLDLGPEQKKYQHSHTMINELRILFDGTVANLLLSRYSQETPLLVQPCPDGEALERWRKAHACFALNSLCLTKGFLDNDVCRCRGACTCMVDYMRQHTLHSVKYLAVLKQSLLTIFEAVSDEECQDIDFAKAYSNEAPSPYTSDEIETLCESATLAEYRALAFHRDVYLLHLCSALKCQPTTVLAVIENVTTERLTLNLDLAFNGALTLSQDISLHLLSPVSRTPWESTKVQLGWLEKIYDTAVAPPQVKQSSIIQLDPNRLSFSIPSVSWQRLLQSAREDDHTNLIACVEEISQSVTSEIENGPKNQQEVLSNQRHQFIPFSMSFSEGQAILVQMYSKVCLGSLQPCVQLVQLTPCLDICLEHRRSPEECFVTLNAVTAHPQVTYSNELKYLCNWLLPAHALESAHQAVGNRERRVTIRGISITWSTENEIRHDKVTPIKGLFTLTKEFCERSSFWPNTVDPVPLKLNERVLHPQQEEIVAECYRQPFVAVVGGFGTGKSTVVACLAHLLVNRNNTVSKLEPGQLMICGPTEASLDILTGYLLRLQSVTKSVIRVYSTETEEAEFPTNTQRGQQLNGSVMKDVALHHVIRNIRSKYGKRLVKEEKLPISERSLGYKDTLEKVQQQCLQEAKIILCTCITSARSILRSATNIKQ
ncbi:helicase with zinc finger domain 2, partial [Elysia marginata]